MQTDMLRNEKGMALISALLLLSAAAVITFAAVQISQLAAFETETAGKHIKEQYKAEGAANMLIFLLSTDAAANPVRDISPLIYEDILTKDRWQADGVERLLTVNGEEFTVAVVDAGGLYAIDSDPLFNNFTENWKHWTSREDQDFDRNLELEYFAAFLQDYCDSSEDNGLYGGEQEYYLQAGMASLPRNGNMQILEELAYIPGTEKFLTVDRNGNFSDFQPIAPAGLPDGVFKPNIYSTPVRWLAHLADLNEVDEEALKTALEQWRHEKKPLTDSLAPEILEQLKSVAPAVESGLYTLRIKQDLWHAEFTLRLPSVMQPHFIEFYSSALP